MKPVFAKMQKRRVVAVMTLVCIFTMLTSMVSFGIDDYTTSNNDYRSLSYSQSKSEPLQDNADFSPQNGNGLAREDGILHYYRDGVILNNGWIKDGNLSYYATPDGVLYSDVKKEIDGNEYVFDKSGIMYTDIFRFEGNAYYANSSGIIQKNQWIDFNGNKYLAKEDGTLYSDTVINIGGNNYGFDIYGRLYTGIFYCKDKKYISGNDGIIKISAWSTVNGSKYYSKDDGSLAVDESLPIDNVSYSFDKDGKLIVNKWLQYSDGYSRYLGENGTFYKNGVFSIDKQLYGFDQEGRLLKGSFAINNDRYYSDNKGVISKNAWNVINGKRYYSNNDGKLMKNGIHKIGQTDYAFNEDGSARSGLFTYNDKLYIASDKGEVLKNGVKNYNGKFYYASTDGHIFKNTLITFGPPKYYAKSDGSLARSETIKYNGKTYKFGSDCVIIPEENPHAKILSIARNEIGTKIGKKYWDNMFGGSPYYVNSYNTPWCACFIKWCFDRAGYSSKISGVRNKAYVPTYTAWGNTNRIWTNSPKPGDIVIFNNSSHIGFVDSVNGRTITTVEGNTGYSYHGEVKRNTYNINSSYIYGFIHY